MNTPHTNGSAPYPDGITPEISEFRWRRVLEGLAAWEPVEGRKHSTLLIAFGVARELGVPREQAEADLFPIVAKWPTKDTTQEAITRHAERAYSPGEEGYAHVHGLRTMGVKLSLKGDPSTKHRRWKNA